MDGGISLSAFLNLQAFSSHCPLNAERQSREAVNTNVEVIGLTRIGIKPETTAPEADALTTRSSKLLKKNYLK